MWMMRIYVTNPPIVQVTQFTQHGGEDAAVHLAGASITEFDRYARLLRRLPRQETEYGDTCQLFVYDEEG